MRRTLVAVVSSLLLGGCGLSEAPGSDDTNTTPDPGLVGFWRVDEPSATPEQQPKPGDMVFAIGTKGGSGPEMELAWVGFDVEVAAGTGESPRSSTLDTGRCAFRTTTIAGRRYASVPASIFSSDAEERRRLEGEAGWFVVRYEVLDASTVHVYLMDVSRVAADVRAGVVPGTADRSIQVPILGELALEYFVLTASTAALRDYLALRGDGIYATDSPLVFRRLALD